MPSASRRSSAPDEAHLDLVEPRRLVRADIGITVGPDAPDVRDRGRDLIIRRTAADQTTQVGPLRREETRVQRAIGREASAGAVRTERLRDRRDDADLPTAVPIAVARGDLAAVARADRLERQLTVDHRDDLFCGNDVIEPPTIGRADVHELDEAEGY